MSSELRNDLRSKILTGEHLKRKRYPLDFFGTAIEIVQPSVADVDKMSNNTTDGEVKLSLVDILIDYAYVPGTDERIFEEGDKDTLRKLPFGKEIEELSELIGELFGGSIKDKEKN